MAIDLTARADSPHHWTIRPIELGRTACELVVNGRRICLEVYDGGGYCAGHGLWRIGGRLIAIVEAGQG
jgi:hypothetical protein